MEIQAIIAIVLILMMICTYKVLGRRKKH